MQRTSLEIESNVLDPQDNGSLDWLDLLIVLASRWRLLVIAPVIAGAAALGVTYFIAPTFTSKTSFLPPQQQQSAAASALASLGALSSFAGGAAGMKSPGDQYVALMQSVNVEDRIIDKFKLMEVYEAKYRFLARKTLETNVRIALGKKDGLITVEVDAKDPQLAADMANQHVFELRRLSGELALTEAQQRRVFFENELRRTRQRLIEAQQVLQSSGFNAGALKAEPKAAAESYARLKAEVTSAEVRLQAMRRGMADTSPDVQQQLALLGALRTQLLKLESTVSVTNDADYISRYREYKYQETLFEMFSRQYEVARLDESREGGLIQVVDVATPPEYKSKPKRGLPALMTAFAVLLLLLIGVPVHHFWREAKKDAVKAARLDRLTAALRRS